MSTAPIQPMQQPESEKRFAFGRNWRRYLGNVDEGAIAEAETSIRNWLGDISGLRFLDLGCGSGLFSLVARRLGATVHSFDFDPDAVACAETLRARFFPGDPRWTTQQGSVLDARFIEGLGQFDIVYSWGVLHHTGDLHTALEHAGRLVRRGGRLWIAIYNELGPITDAWIKIKRAYVAGPVGRAAVLGTFVPMFFLGNLVADLARLRSPMTRYREYRASHRGMSRTVDWIDWLGGYPYQPARAEAIFDFFRQRGFKLLRLRSVYGWGNNQFLFEREAPVAAV
ncbi:MAG TPA: class I SAM-dependent methyltransferase [Polyangia bacterium]|nr:class I SAM-dependent methyltransferase [Polyangia bacterium]